MPEMSDEDISELAEYLWEMCRRVETKHALRVVPVSTGDSDIPWDTACCCPLGAEARVNRRDRSFVHYPGPSAAFRRMFLPEELGRSFAAGFDGWKRTAEDIKEHEPRLFHLGRLFRKQALLYGGFK